MCACERLNRFQLRGREKGFEYTVDEIQRSIVYINREQWESER